MATDTGYSQERIFNKINEIKSFFSTQKMSRTVSKEINSKCNGFTTIELNKNYLADKKLNKIEKNKQVKDGLEIFEQIEDFAKTGWEEMDKTDLELRLKWFGMFWRPKTPGQFMLRLRVPNGILNTKQLSVIASIISRYGKDGSCDITTRQNLQLRGILISDLPEILFRLKECGINTIQSGFDNPRNVTGNPLAGIDPKEIIDTRPYTEELDKYLTNNGRGNSNFSNLPRKWNTAVAGAKDNFLLHNDLIFHPVYKDGELGFVIWVGGILSSQLNEYAIPLNAWVKSKEISKVTGIILSIWRDNGERYTRPKGRFRFFLNNFGVDQFRKEVEKHYGKIDEDPGSNFSEKPRSIFGINNQKQKGLFYAGIHIPVGRLRAEDLQDLSEISAKFGENQIRLTEDQNIILEGIKEKDLNEFKSQKILIKFPLYPKEISAGTVSCTGNSYCSFALTNTKDTALEITKELEEVINLHKELKIHWTGCPNSCGQAYMGAIGLTGKKAKNSEGITVEAYDISIGGSQGKDQKIASLKYKSIPKENLKDKLKEILIEKYGATEKKVNAKGFRLINWFKKPSKRINSS